MKIFLTANLLIESEMKQLAALDLSFDLGDQRELEDDYRYSAVGE